jgi:hypothetical protein
MDGQRFDAWTRRLSYQTSRRTMLHAFAAAGAFVGLIHNSPAKAGPGCRDDGQSLWGGWSMLFRLLWAARKGQRASLRSVFRSRLRRNLLSAGNRRLYDIRSTGRVCDGGLSLHRWDEMGACVEHVRSVSHRLRRRRRVLRGDVL